MCPLNLRNKPTGLIILVFLVTACSSIEIRKPTDTQKFLLSPNQLVVVHKGCGSVKEETFRAWLDKDEPNEQDITNYFYYTDNKWVADNISLPDNRHMFTAYADVRPGAWCYESKSTDHQEIHVIQLPTPIKVMPLGDSLTRGCCTISGQCNIGYRHYLSTKLIGEGYSVEFVGSQQHPTISCSDPNTPTDFDKDHEGYYGKTTQWLRANVGSFLQQNPPDIVLLHIGTNDLKDSNSGQIPGYVANVQAILQTIFDYSADNNKTIVVFVALIIDQKPTNPLVSEYNEALSTMVKERIEQDDPIILLNMQTGAGLDYAVDISDDFSPNQLHPTPSGYVKMAKLWYRTLVAVIGPP